MDGWRRQAIYFAPPAGGPLARFGAAWLGWDPEAGVALPVPEARAALVAAPARYGFHATLKPPFRLAGSEAALDAAVAALAAGSERFALRLRLGRMGGFLALVPGAAPPALAALADACVKRLDGFRAPADAAELARRREGGLDAAAEANLVAWGYPYVLDRFRFHMTLTGPVPAAARDAVAAAVAPLVTPLLAAPVAVGGICRVGEADDGRFRIIRRYPLG
ncbi:MAG TPA: DUF1045 domain-containing protein [Amaricoccus sp.]|jgi:hypothetical protein|nr:DUF1045 domain-containing protein [Amaricoccus sp.]